MDLITLNDPSTYQPFLFSVIEDDGENLRIEVSTTITGRIWPQASENETLKPGRYRMKRTGFLARHSELKLKVKRA
jgi:hypothetical protein